MKQTDTVNSSRALKGGDFSLRPSQSYKLKERME